MSGYGKLNGTRIEMIKVTNENGEVFVQVPVEELAQEKSEKAKMVSLAIDGLIYDGAHHKQYYLAEILSILVQDNQEFDGLRDTYEWEDGIPA